MYVNNGIYKLPLSDLQKKTNHRHLENTLVTHLLPATTFSPRRVCKKAFKLGSYKEILEIRATITRAQPFFW